MDEDPVNRNETEDMQISIGGGDGKYTSVTIGEQKFQLLERELTSLQKCVNTTVNDIPENNKRVRFDERVLVLGLTDIDGIGDKTAISIAKVAATNGFENLTIDDITEVRGISISIAEEVLIYLRGFYHGHQKHASM